MPTNRAATGTDAPRSRALRAMTGNTAPRPTDHRAVGPNAGTAIRLSENSLTLLLPCDTPGGAEPTRYLDIKISSRFLRA
jgi:hypothetical protein